MIIGTWLPKFETINGAKGNKDMYLSRMVWGRLRIHCFHRGDNDPDCHDHQWDFWTFPLSRHRYYEQVLEQRTDSNYYRTVNVVDGWKWTAVKAEHRHRVLFPAKIGEDDKPIWTIVWTGPVRRPTWGFWIFDKKKPRFIDWKTYIFGDKHAVDAPSTID